MKFGAIFSFSLIRPSATFSQHKLENLSRSEATGGWDEGELSGNIFEMEARSKSHECP
jgi:hypothetical protein